MSNRTKIGVAVTLLMLIASPLSFADDQDHDMADRVYEKYKEREQNQSKEKRTRRSSRGSDNDRDPKATSERDRRADSNRERRAEKSTRSRERSSERRVYDRSNSNNSNRHDNNRDSLYRSSARDEDASRQTGEQLSRGIRDLITRKSQRRQSTDRSSRSQSTNDRQIRSYSESSDSDVRETVSLDQAVNIVRRQSDGKVISARSEGSGASRKHRIKVLIGERRVRTYVVSATTGKVY